MTEVETVTKEVIEKDPPRNLSRKSASLVKRHWLTLAFILGFIVDNLTLNRVDQLFDNLILLSYVIIAMVALLILYAGAAAKLPEQWVPRARKYAPLLVQYAFGGLLSGMLIFYGRSGSWADSWPFLIVIIGVIYGNETIKERATRLVFNLAVFFIALFSYVVLVIPVLTGHMGPWIFVGSGMLALMLMYGFIQLLFKIIPNFLSLHMRTVVFTIGTIFMGFNMLYFTNVIPPIPLSLKDVGIYHSVVRFENGDYQVKYEKGSWWQPFKNSDDTFHAHDGDNIFCFAKVFAPTKINTEIFHKWEFYDEDKGEWRAVNRLSYGISGGRDGGFRGYTLIKNYQAGKWRCTVETGRGQVLGRETFEVEEGGEAPELETRVE